MDPAKIQENMRQRDIIAYVFDFVVETIAEENFTDVERFARLLVDAISDKYLRAPEVNSQLMSPDESSAFGKRRMLFGEFEGTQ